MTRVEEYADNFFKTHHQRTSQTDGSTLIRRTRADRAPIITIRESPESRSKRTVDEQGRGQASWDDPHA